MANKSLQKEYNNNNNNNNNINLLPILGPQGTT
jgi:hypothetical protein